MFRKLLPAALVVAAIVLIANAAAKASDPPFPSPHPTAKFVQIEVTKDPFTGVQRITLDGKNYAVVNDFGPDGKPTDALPLPDGYDKKHVWVVPETGLRDGHPHLRVFWNCFPTSKKTTRGMMLIK